MKGENRLFKFAFSPDGAILATGEAKGVVTLWDVATGKVIESGTKHDGWVRFVAFSPDGKLLASAADPKAITVESVPRRKDK